MEGNKTPYHRVINKATRIIKIVGESKNEDGKIVNAFVKEHHDKAITTPPPNQQYQTNNNVNCVKSTKRYFASLFLRIASVILYIL